MRCAPTASCSSASRRPSCRSPSAIFCIEGDERMRRIVGVISGNAEGASDVLRLDHDLRSRRRMVFNTAGGNSVLLDMRSEEHTSELQSLMRTSYAVFCLNKKKNNTSTKHQTSTSMTL